MALFKEIINNAYEELNNIIADKVEQSDRFYFEVLFIGFIVHPKNHIL